MAVQNELFGVKWTLNKQSSKFTKGWSPESETRLYEETPNGYKLSVNGVHEGKPYSWGYDAKYDGKDHPVHGREDADAIEAYKVNERITLGFFKKGGQLCGPYARKLSTDGSSLTVQSVGRRADGSAFFDVIQYQKP